MAQAPRRIQVAALPEAPTPAATAGPSAQLVQARRVDTSGGLFGSLAAALQDINPQIQESLWTREKESRADDLAAVKDRISGLTYDEATELVRSGSIDRTESPFYQAAFKKQYGIVYAGQRKQELMDRYAADFDKFGGDVEEFLASAAREDLEQFSGDKFILAGIREGMGNFAQEVRDSHRESVRKATQDTALSRFPDTLATAYGQALADGRDPIAATRQIAEEQAKVLGITGPQIDEAMVNLARSYAAQGKVDEARKILETEITAADGTKLGAYATRPAYAAKAAAILEEGKAKATDELRIASTQEILEIRDRASKGILTTEDKARVQSLREDGIISQSEYEGALTAQQRALEQQAQEQFANRIVSEEMTAARDAMLEGRGWTTQDRTVTMEDGRQFTVKADDIRKRVVAEVVSEAAAAGKTTPEIAAIVSSLGVQAPKIPQWEGALNAGHLALTEATAKADATGRVEIPAQTMAGFETYRSLGQFPSLRDSHTTPEAAAIYSDAELLMEFGGMDAGAALAEAASADRTVANPVPRLSTKEVSEALADTDFAEASNSGKLGQNMNRLASIYMRDFGKSPEVALSMARKAIEDSTVLINGTAVSRLSSYVTADFEDAATVTVREFLKGQGDDEDDFTLVPVDPYGKQWMVVGTGDIPLPHPTNKTFTLREINETFAASERRRLESERLDQLDPSRPIQRAYPGLPPERAKALAEPVFKVPGKPGTAARGTPVTPPEAPAAKPKTRKRPRPVPPQ